MADLATLEKRLAAADDAYHELMMGARAVKVGFGPGKSVEYTEATAPRLKSYISFLQNEIARAKGQRTRGPIRPHWGR